LGFSLSQTDGPFKSPTIRRFCQPSDGSAFPWLFSALSIFPVSAIGQTQ